MKITTGAKNNNTTTNGFLLCFRPFPMGDEAANSTTLNVDPDLMKSFSVIEKSKPKPKHKSSSKVHSCDKESTDVNQKKTARRRILSKIVKAMAFQSSLKVRNGKIIQDRTDFRNQKSRRRSSSSSEEENDSSISSSILSSSSSSLSISSSSSIASSWNTSSSDSSRSLGSLSGRHKSFRSDSIEDEKKQNISSSSTTDNKKKKITGICLLLISLFVLIFWGKFFAIICTSTWFYFVSTTRRDSVGGDKERQMLIKLPVDIPSKEYKKKIIMEGFLERTRNQHRGVFHHHQH